MQINANPKEINVNPWKSMEILFYWLALATASRRASTAVLTAWAAALVPTCCNVAQSSWRNAGNRQSAICNQQ